MPKNQELQQNPELNKGTGLKCEFCGALEGERHPVRGFKVEISTPLGQPEGSMSACQVCRVAYRREKQELKLNKSKSKPEKQTERYKILMLIAVLIFGSIVLVGLAALLIAFFDAV